MSFSRRSGIIAVVVIVVALIIAGVILWLTMVPQPAAQSSPSAVSNLLLQQAKVIIPSVATSSIIAVTQLPSFVRTLVLPGASGTIARAILYAGSRRGYDISYSDPELLQDAYRAFTDRIGPGGWVTIHSARAEIFAYSEFSGNGLNARAEFTATTASLTAVLVSVAQE
jgi:hypothetical protein